MPKKGRDFLCISFVHHKGKYNWKIQFCKILPHVSSHPPLIHTHLVEKYWRHFPISMSHNFTYIYSQSSEITTLVFGEWILLKGETLKLNLHFKFTVMKILEILSLYSEKIYDWQFQICIYPGMYQYLLNIMY